MVSFSDEETSSVAVKHAYVLSCDRCGQWRACIAFRTLDHYQLFLLAAHVAILERIYSTIA